MTRIVGRLLGGSVLSALDHTPLQKAPPAVGGAPFSCSLSQLLLRIEKQQNKEDLGGDGRKTAANPAELAICEHANKQIVLLST